MFWILHGEDEFRRSEFLADLKRDLGDPVMLDVNTTILDGRRITLRDIVHACDTVPFLSENRLVIVKDLLAHLQGGKKRGKGSKKASETETASSSEGADSPRTSFLKELQDYLRRLPDTTSLVFVESELLAAKHPLRSLAREDRDRGRIQEFRPFSAYGRDGPGQLARWIKNRAQDKGLELTSEAVQVLATHVGCDLRLMDQELEKLSAYADGQRAISGADIRQMVSSVREADIFEMVDALGQRDVRRATVLLHQMLDEGKAPLYLLTMIVRQFRIMIQVKELSTLGFSTAEAARQLRLHEFVVRKCLGQARSVSFEQLCSIYDSLAEYDAAIKTGRIDDTLALDLLIAEACAVQFRTQSAMYH